MHSANPLDEDLGMEKLEPRTPRQGQHVDDHRGANRFFGSKILESILKNCEEKVSNKGASGTFTACWAIDIIYEIAIIRYFHPSRWMETAIAHDRVVHFEFKATYVSQDDNEEFARRVCVCFCLWNS